MKFLSILVSVILISSFAIADIPVLVCNEIDLAVKMNKTTGELTYKHFVINLTVSADRDTKYGYKASYISLDDKEQVEEKDTAYKSGTFDIRKNKSRFIHLSEFLYPGLNKYDVKILEYANIGVKLNDEESTGIEVWKMYSADGKVLGNIIRSSWGFWGKCDD